VHSHLWDVHQIQHLYAITFECTWPNSQDTCFRTFLCIHVWWTLDSFSSDKADIYTLYKKVGRYKSGCRSLINIFCSLVKVSDFPITNVRKSFKRSFSNSCQNVSICFFVKDNYCAVPWLVICTPFCRSFKYLSNAPKITFLYAIELKIRAFVRHGSMPLVNDSNSVLKFCNEGKGVGGRGGEWLRKLIVGKIHFGIWL